MSRKQNKARIRCIFTNHNANTNTNTWLLLVLLTLSISDYKQEIPDSLGEKILVVETTTQSLFFFLPSSLISQYRTAFLRFSLLPLLVFWWLENYLDSRIKHRFYILLKRLSKREIISKFN